MINSSEMAKMIDHTLLGPTSSSEGVARLCEEAEKYEFASVCVNPIFVPEAEEALSDSSVKVCTVIGFPHGTHKGGTKGFEAQLSVEDGADELDMVVNIPSLTSHCYRVVEKDISSVTRVAEESCREVTVKVILEMGVLDRREKVAGAIIAQAAGADFVKTSTGFGFGGAQVKDVELLREVVGEEMGIKAAGGISNYEEALEFIEAGATRIGASRGVQIVEGAPDDRG